MNATVSLSVAEAGFARREHIDRRRFVFRAGAAAPPFPKLRSGHYHIAQPRTADAIRCQLPDLLGESGHEDVQSTTGGATGSYCHVFGRI
jgi:hypothetical protein